MAVKAQPKGPFGPITESYPLPTANYRVVSPNGSGTQYTLANPGVFNADALNTAPSGATIVFRGGTYRLGDISYNKTLTLQPYLNEVPVLNGSEIATNWVQSGNYWEITWNNLFNEGNPPTYNTGGNPAIHNLEIVVLDNVPLSQVDEIGLVNSETFFVDYVNNKITIGVNPNNKLVELAKYRSGLTRNQGDSNNIEAGAIRGLTFKNYATSGFISSPSEPEPNEAVNINISGVEMLNLIVENNIFINNGRLGAVIRGDNAVVSNNEFAYNGFHGVTVKASNNVTVKNNWVHHNNYNKVVFFPAAIKILNQCSGITVKNNLVEYNKNTGIWFDIGIKNSSIVNNLLRNNSHSSIKVEISKDGIIAGNLIVNNKGTWDGINILNCGRMKVYNNTISGVTKSIKIRRDHRNNQSAFGWHADTGVGPGNYENHEVANNLIVLGRSSLLEIVENNVSCKQDIDAQVDLLDFNGYHRSDSSSPDTFLRWSVPQASLESANCVDDINNNNYLTLDSFKSSYSEYETNGFEIIGVDDPFFVDSGNTDIEARDFSLKNNSEAFQAGKAIPEDVRDALEWTASSKIDMGAFQSNNATPPTTENIIIRAKMISGASDMLELKLDDNTVHTWTVTGSDYADYTYAISGTHNVKLFFQDNGTDMQIDYIKVGSDIYQSEDQSENTSVWQGGSCGGSYSEMMSCSGHINFGTVEVKPAQLNWVEDFTDQPNGTTNDSGSTAWTSSRATGVFEVENGSFKTTVGNEEGVWMSEEIDISAYGDINISVDVDDADDTKEPTDYLEAFYIINGDGNEISFGSVTGNISAQPFTETVLKANTIQIVIRAKVSFTGETYFFDNVTVSGSPLVPLDWVEDFTDQPNGTTIDNGTTAWTSSRTTGVFEVENGSFKTTVGIAEGVWMSEEIDISASGDINISVDVDDADDTKEPTDYLNAFYKLDNGTEISFGSVTGNISAQPFTKTGLNGNKIQIVIRAKVSFTSETYSFDNVTVSSSSSNSAKSNSAKLATINQEPVLEESIVEIYPNPVTSHFSIKGISDGPYHISICNLRGEQIREFNGTSNGIVTLTVSNLNEGVYILKIVNELTNSVLKFVKK
jgi:hypothetical protein